MTRNKQKEEELIYLKKFLECMECKPDDVKGQEKPDAVITIGLRRIGVEVTLFHSAPDDNQKFSRRQVEEAWAELQKKIHHERDKHNVLHDVSGVLSFKELKVPLRPKHKQFVKEIIKYALSKLPSLDDLGKEFLEFPADYPLMHEYLESISLQRNSFADWDWNHISAWVGLLEDELVNILENKIEKLKQYERTNISEMWLLIVSGVQISQSIGIPHPEELNTYFRSNTLLEQSGFDRVYIYQYLRDRVIAWSANWRVIREAKRRNDRE